MSLWNRERAPMPFKKESLDRIDVMIKKKAPGENRALFFVVPTILSND